MAKQVVNMLEVLGSIPGIKKKKEKRRKKKAWSFLSLVAVCSVNCIIYLSILKLIS